MSRRVFCRTICQDRSGCEYSFVSLNGFSFVLVLEHLCQWISVTCFYSKQWRGKLATHGQCAGSTSLVSLWCTRGSLRWLTPERRSSTSTSCGMCTRMRYSFCVCNAAVLFLYSSIASLIQQFGLDLSWCNCFAKFFAILEPTILILTNVGKHVGSPLLNLAFIPQSF